MSKFCDAQRCIHFMNHCCISNFEQFPDLMTSIGFLDKRRGLSKKENFQNGQNKIAPNIHVQASFIKHNVFVVHVLRRPGEEKLWHGIHWRVLVQACKLSSQSHHQCLCVEQFTTTFYCSMFVLPINAQKSRLCMFIQLSTPYIHHVKSKFSPRSAVRRFS